MRMRFHRRHWRERGVAIITALLLTTLAITIVASLFWQQQVQVRSIENQRLQLQTRWILRGALDWGMLILREDGKFSTVDHQGEPWAVPLAETRLDEYVERGSTPEGIDATLSGRIIDAQSRFNLTNLATQEGNVDQQAVTVFERLLSNLRLNPELARGAATAVAAGKRSATSSDTSGNVMSIMHLEDLLTVSGFTPQTIDALKEYVVVLPRLTSLNVNTAPAEVLAARIDTLSISDATSLTANRGADYFRKVDDFEQRLPRGALPEDTKRMLSVSSSYFIVYGSVKLDRATQEMRALIERSGSGPNVTTKVIWIRNN